MALAIDEVVDDYEKEDRVDVKDDVVRNSTFNCMELNYSSGASKKYENFTEYTEVDVGADRIQRTDYHIDHKAYRNEITYLYYDKGVNYFTDFEHQFQARSALDQTLSNGIIWMLSNVLGDGVALINSNDDYLAINFYRGTSYPQITLRECDGGVSYVTSVNNPVANTWYYFTVKKIGVNFICEIYTNSIRTILFSNLTLTLHHDYLFRYIYGCNTFNVPSANFQNNDIEYLWIGDMLGGYDPDGYFTTTNFLAGLSDNATVLLTNTTIPSGSINAQISNDGSTWSDLGGLDVGYGAIDLRALGFTNATMMFNYTRGDQSETPRLFQVRLVHEGNATVGPGVATPVDETPFIAIGLILAMAMVLLANKARK